MSLSGCETLNDMIARARERKIDLEHLGKRKPERTHISMDQVKRTRTQDSCVGGHQGWGCCAKYGRISGDRTRMFQLWSDGSL